MQQAFHFYLNLYHKSGRGHIVPSEKYFLPLKVNWRDRNVYEIFFLSVIYRRARLRLATSLIIILIVTIIIHFITESFSALASL